MRNYLIWTLSILLGFEPALWAEGTAQQQAQIKAFIEKSEIAKRPVSIKELYQKNAASLTASDKKTLANFVYAYGDEKLPKMDVTKIKGRNGKENVQLQFVKDGHSMNLEIINEGDVFARLNGQVLTMNDMQSIEGLMIKAGVSVSDAKRNFSTSGRAPASTGSKFLNAKQIQKLSKPEQIQYFKQLRQLLESMEAVEHATLKHNSSFNYEPSKFEIIAALLTGENAFAIADGPGQTCTAAGWEAESGFNSSKRLKCGTDGKDGVAEKYRRLPNGELCPPDKFACNPGLYGNYQQSLCFVGNETTTAKCNEAIKDQDIPDLAKDRGEFDKLAGKAEEEAKKIAGFCGPLNGSSSADQSGADQAPSAQATKGTKKSSGKRKGSKPDYSGLTKDQKTTCKNFQARYDEIMSWNCETNPTFRDKHKNLCEVVSDEKPEKQEPEPVAKSDEKPGIKDCNSLPDNLAKEGTQCEDGSVTNLTGENEVIKCLDGVKYRQIVRCECSPGHLIGKFKCSKPDIVDAVAGEGPGNRKLSAKQRKEAQGPNWWLIGGIALGGLALFHYMNKKTLQQQQTYLEPVPPAPPIPVPTDPVPRTGVQ
jgi:hypothetical protein